MSLTAKYAKGTHALGICQRCGQRALLHELVMDGYYPLLRVHQECYDPKHPQERLPKVSDPQVLWRPSPEQAGIAPVLSGMLNQPTAPVLSGSNSDTTNSLSWTASAQAVAAVAGYRLYYPDNMLVFDTADPLILSFEDTGLASDSYTYYVVSYDEDGNISSHSNEVTLIVVSSTRILSSVTFNYLGIVPYNGYNVINNVTDPWASANWGSINNDQLSGFTILSLDYAPSGDQGMHIVLQSNDLSPVPDGAFTSLSWTDDGAVARTLLVSNATIVNLSGSTKSWRWKNANGNWPFPINAGFSGGTDYTINIV